MSQMTRAERMDAFLKTVAECTHEGGYPMTQPAQQFIHAILNEKPEHTRRNELMTFAERVAFHFTGAEYQITRSYEDVLKSIPCENETGKLARHAIDKVGLSIGLRAPHARCFE